MQHIQQKPKFIYFYGNEIFIFSTLLVLSRFLPPSLGTTILFLSSVYVSSRFLPGESTAFKLSVSSLFFIGLSPFYLILRGVFTKTYLTDWDFQLYSLIYLVTTLLIVEYFLKPRLDLNIKFKLNNKVACSSFFGLFFASVVEMILYQKSVGHAVAWVASGDSKNHLVNGVEIVKYGFLDPTTFFTQPVSSPTYLSLVLSQNKLNFLNGSGFLEIQMQNYAWVWILLIGVLGVTFAATFELVWNWLNPDSKQPPLQLIALSSFMATFSVAIGPALADGFFTAILGISAVLVMTIWFIEVQRLKDFSLSYVIIGFLILVGSLFSWMFVILLNSILFLIGVRENLKSVSNLKFIKDLYLILFILVAVFYVHNSNFGQSLIFKVKYALTANGAVTASNPNFYISLIGIFALAGIFYRRSHEYFGKALTLLSFSHFFSLLAFKQFSNLSILEWNYYLLKYQWIACISLIIVLFCILTVTFHKNIKYKGLKLFPITLLLAITTFFFSESLVSANRIWQKIWNGWENPRSEMINKMLEMELESENPTLFFHYGYSGDARLVNFWSTAFVSPAEPLRGWNYTIDTSGDPNQLCDVNAYYPTVNVVTSDLTLSSQLQVLCPSEQFKISLQPPL